MGGKDGMGYLLYPPDVGFPRIRMDVHAGITAIYIFSIVVFLHSGGSPDGADGGK